MFSDKGAYTTFPSATGNTEANPIVELPESVDKILEGVDVVILTHSHIDHWDDAAAEAIDKNMPIYVQHQKDKEHVEKSGFVNVEILPQTKSIGEVELTRTDTKHYENEAAKNTLIEFDFVTDIMGIVFKANNEKTTYLPADTIYYERVAEAIDTHNPEVIIANLGGNAFDNGRLIMDANDLKSLQQKVTEAEIVATHMEAVNHRVTSRADLVEVAQENNFVEKLFVPEDGEMVVL